MGCHQPQLPLLLHPQPQAQPPQTQPGWSLLTGTPSACLRYNTQAVQRGWAVHCTGITQAVQYEQHNVDSAMWAVCRQFMRSACADGTSSSTPSGVGGGGRGQQAAGTHACNVVGHRAVLGSMARRAVQQRQALGSTEPGNQYSNSKQFRTL